MCTDGRADRLQHETEAMTTLALSPASPAPLALLARRTGVFSLQLLLLGILLHRFGSLPTPVAINLFKVALGGAGLAVAFGLIASTDIWIRGRAGASNAVIGAAIALAMLAWPAAYMPSYMKLPRINDVTTDTASPPPFVALAKQRGRAANPSTYAGAAAAVQQLEAYPDVRPFVIPRSATDAFDLVADVIRRMRWEVVAEQAPKGPGRPGTIEAVDRTPILGFYDDIAIRIDGDQERARIDMRSASRYGTFDLGRNASRVRAFYREVLARIEGVSTGDRRARRRLRRIEPPLKGAKGEIVQKGASKTSPGPAQSGAGRAPVPKATQRSRGERRDRDRQ